MILSNTRPTPPWSGSGPGGPNYVNTFLVKNIRVFLTRADVPAPGVLNVEIAREFLYSAPSVVWAQEG